MNKVQTIERSLRCFSFSLWGLLPILGFPFALHSLFESARIRRSPFAAWNPARTYVDWSTALGFIGALISVLLLFFIGLALLNQYIHGSSGSGGAE